MSCRSLSRTNKKVPMKQQGRKSFAWFNLVMIFTGLIIINTYSNGITIIAIDSLDKKYQHLRNNNTIKCALWKDKTGLHYLGIDHIKTVAFDGISYISRITAYSFIIENMKVSKEIWRIKDFAPNPLSSVSYLNQSLRIVDIDNDSIAETCFLYAIFSDCCDAWVTKLILHKNGEKLAIRGQIPIHEDDLASYQKVFDPSFAKYDARFKVFASEEWDKAVRIHWKDILGDSLVDKLISMEYTIQNQKQKKVPSPKNEEKKNLNGHLILQLR